MKGWKSVVFMIAGMLGLLGCEAGTNTPQSNLSPQPVGSYTYGPPEIYMFIRQEPPYFRNQRRLQLLRKKTSLDETMIISRFMHLSKEDKRLFARDAFMLLVRSKTDAGQKMLFELISEWMDVTRVEDCGLDLAREADESVCTEIKRKLLEANQPAILRELEEGIRRANRPSVPKKAADKE